MTIYTLLSILGMSLGVVMVAVALDVIPGYLRDKKLEEALARATAARELARLMETTMAIKVVTDIPPKKYVGKHRLAA